MIVVDSSVFIAVLRGQGTEAARRFRTEVDPEDIVVGDLVILEVLQGAESDRHAAAIARELRAFVVMRMLDPEIAMKAADNFRRLRRLGATMRKTVDLIIGTFCIENGHALLHQDQDYDPMVEHLGLKLA